MKIKMPSGYFFGISAASADTPDSFEVYKFVASTPTGITRELPRRDPPSQQPTPPASNPGAAVNDQPSHSSSSDIQLAAQVTDLQNRLQSMSQQVENVFREVQQLVSKFETRHQELAHKITSNEQLSALDRRIQSFENTLRSYDGQFSSIQGALKDSHSTLNEGLSQHMTHRKCRSPKYHLAILTMSSVISTKSPKTSSFVIALIVFQLLLAGSYIMYKRRRANGPKKYL